jgi:hypothetical protein
MARQRSLAARIDAHLASAVEIAFCGLCLAAWPIGARLSSRLRPLWLLTSPAARTLVWRSAPTPGPNRLLPRIRQHLPFSRHFRHAPPLLPQTLRPLPRFSLPHRGRTVAQLGFAAPSGAAFALPFHIPLPPDPRHAKRLDDLPRPHGPVGDPPAGEHPETLPIALLVWEHGQVAVQVLHGAGLLLHGDATVDLGHPSGKERQLESRHPSLFSPTPFVPQIQFGLILICDFFLRWWRIRPRQRWG